MNSETMERYMQVSGFTHNEKALCREVFEACPKQAQTLMLAIVAYREKLRLKKGGIQ